MTKEERSDTKMATLYELRLIIANGDKEQYSRKELMEMIDKIAMAKDQK